MIGERGMCDQRELVFDRVKCTSDVGAKSAKAPTDPPIARLNLQPRIQFSPPTE
jgi:hypothetical protein